MALTSARGLQAHEYVSGESLSLMLHNKCIAVYLYHAFTHCIKKPQMHLLVFIPLNE